MPRPLKFVACLALVGALVAVPMLAGAAGRARPDRRNGLQRARLLVDSIGASSPRFGPRDLTHVMRDLALALEDLEGEERARAETLLARPTVSPAAAFGYSAAAAQKRACDPLFCITWVTGTPDAPPPADDDSDGIPNQVETTAQVFNEVYAAEVGAMGYRAPKPDADSRIDVYLYDLGREGLYGGCIPEYSFSYRFHDFAGYCMVDDDFSAAQYQPVNGVDALRVTAAHEFFHLIQFGYDTDEDIWLMEGTATWIEDELYDDINDNYQFLEHSALVLPRRALDNSGGRRRLAVYGTWLFFRYLTEHLGGNGPDPTIVRAIWERADGRKGAPNDYSMEAVERVVSDRGRQFTDFFAAFTAGNNFAETSYEEGAGYVAAVGPVPAAEVILSPSYPSATRKYGLKHLSSANLVFRPGLGSTDTGQLKLKLRLPALETGAVAVVQLVTDQNVVENHPVPLDAFGDGTLTVPFGSTSVAGVYVTLTNASTRFRNCKSDTEFSCGGYPIDEGRTYRVKAVALP